MDELIDIEKFFDGDAAKLAFDQIKSDGRHEQIIARNEQSDDDMNRSTTASGGIEWQARYKPFGETRWTSGALTTNRKFNGMKEESALGGIYDFNARFGVYPERSEGIPRSGGS
jgi:hypothetical protein